MLRMPFQFSLFIAFGFWVALSPVTAQRPSPILVTDAVLQNPEPADWLRWRRDHTANGYSPLDQITPQNAKDLRLAWAMGMEAGPNEQEPIVYKGIMYLLHSNDVIQALTAGSGELIWEYRRRLPRDAQNDTTRNISIYQDKIFSATSDGFLIALDANTGKLVWENQVADTSSRIRFSTGPIAGDGKIFAGQTCGVGSPKSCSLSAYDVNTGEELWKRESVAGPSDPPEHNATWGDVPHELRRKASFWMAGSYDPELKLVYWTTASAYPYPELHKGGTKGGDLLYTNSILALDPDSGEIRWFFQMQPRDNFDMDQQDNPILADVEIGGRVRKVVFTLGKPGILWAFDRQTGEHLWNQQLVPYQNIYQSIDPDSGAIVMNQRIIPKKVGDAPLVCPGMRGGKLFQTNSFNPRTNAIYSTVSNECTVFEVVPIEVSRSGAKYDQIEHMEGSGGKVGSLTAVSGSTGEMLWTYDQRVAMGSVLTTGGGLVFAGDLHRYFRAFDAQSGRIVWEIPLNGPVTGYPISYETSGKQYVAVAVGGHTSGQRHMARLYPELSTPATSNVLMVFSLGE